MPVMFWFVSDMPIFKLGGDWLSEFCIWAIGSRINTLRSLTDGRNCRLYGERTWSFGFSPSTAEFVVSQRV